MGAYLKIDLFSLRLCGGPWAFMLTSPPGGGCCQLGPRWSDTALTWRTLSPCCRQNPGSSIESRGENQAMPLSRACKLTDWASCHRRWRLDSWTLSGLFTICRSYGETGAALVDPQLLLFYWDSAYMLPSSESLF